VSNNNPIPNNKPFKKGQSGNPNGRPKKAQRDYEKGSIHILDVLFDRVYGKPKEEVEQTVNGGKPDKIEIVIHRPEKK
jgi:hypothetical protein